MKNLDFDHYILKCLLVGENLEIEDNLIKKIGQKKF